LRSGTIAFLLGACLLLHCTRLPAAQWSWLLLPAILLPLRWPALRFPCCLAAGFLWGLARAAPLLERGLAPELADRPLVLVGEIASLPERRGDSLRFVFRIVERRPPPRAGTGSDMAPSAALPARVRLSWYRQAARLVPGERWQLRVRLRPPHGYRNPGGFDYEGWLFRHGLRATGYVLNHPDNRRLPSVPGRFLDRLRQELGAAVRTRLAASSEVAALVQALGVGDRSGISAEQWRVLRRTGTAHLLAISGLHIGLLAAFAGGLSRCILLRLLPGALLGKAWASRLPILIAWVAAAGYAGLAGFSLPTRRALLMFSVLAAACLRRRRPAWDQAFCCALLAVLVADPLAPADAGFWLSFLAVAGILFGMAGRRPGAAPGRWLRMQLLVSLALLPVLLAWFGGYPLLSLPANLLAVPWVTFLVLPAALAGIGLLPWLPAIAAIPLQFAAAALELLWPLLESLTALRWGLLQPPQPSWPALLLAAAGVFMLCLPRGVAPRALGFCCLLPALLPVPPRPAPGELHFALLDVGQGLAAVALTRNHTLVYDTGPRFSSGGDNARITLLPYLRSLGVQRLDRLVISHGDSDHAGGLESVLAEFPGTQVYSGTPGALPPPVAAKPCRDGSVWDWDGVRFEFLHPGDDDILLQGNDRSCVLRIAAQGQRLLLPGDLQAAGERALLARHRRRFRAELLLIPHHGSRTSSTIPFVTAVEPAHVLVPVGYRNRFRLPKPDIIARYARRGAIVRSTAKEGMIEARVARGALHLRSYRAARRRFWHERVE